MKHQLFFLSLSFLFSGCASFSLYQESDCAVPPERYGQCYADLGYKPVAYEQLAKFCEARGKIIDVEKFKTARAQRLVEQCSQPNEVFTLEYRAAVHVNGPETCPEELLTTEVLKKAAKDGREAGLAYRFSLEEADEALKAKDRDLNEEQKGFFTWFFNTLLRTSPAEHEERSRIASVKSESLRNEYPGVRALNERLKCNSSGWY